MPFDLRSALVAALLFAVPTLASAQDVGLEPDQRAQLSAAAFDADALDRVTWSADRDAPQFLAGDLGAVSSPEAFYRENAAALGFTTDPDVRVLEAETDELGLTHVRVQQTVGDVPIWGAESAVHLRDGRVYAWGGAVHPDADVSTAPALDESAALEAARRDIGDVPLRADVPGDALAEAIDWTPTTELVVYPLESRQAGAANGSYRLAYHVRVFVDQPVPANWETFVDATTGEVLHRFNSLHTAGLGSAHADDEWAGAPYARQASSSILFANGTGGSIFGGTRPVTTLLYQGQYYLYDTSRGPQYIRTMTSGGGNSLPGSYVTDADNNFPASAAVDAHYGAISTFDYFKNTHGRNSYNGSNATITSTVNYDDQPGGAGYNNAFWNGQQMVYGDGDGQSFIALVSLDIAAHELTHAVTGTSAGLIYQNESGALNEAVSDIMAVMVDRNDYKIGEDSYTPGTSGDALRYLDDPSRGNQPDNYADRYTGSQDNGGVHINSGIANKQAYLMIAGGTFRGQAVQAVGRTVTEKVWYRALTQYFTQSTNFAGARQGTIQAATDLYGAGSAQVTSVTNAWAAVGVGSAANGGGNDGGGTGGGTPEWRYEDRTYQSPHNYPNNYNATNTYTKAGASRVAMYFQQFETEANYDFVNVLDESGTRQARYTGTRSAFWAVVDGSSISANLTSDYSVTRYGYRVTRVAYFSDRPLLVGGGSEGEPLGFVPVAAPSDVASSSVKVEELALEVGPNPAVGAATAIVSLPEAGDVTVTVVDLLGREVLSSTRSYGEGRHSVGFDTSRLPAGAYVVVLEVGGDRMTSRLT
ncbi:M4 family metallopeptidase, partial [Rubrivirga sp.]|uniref:M4 family metallopeptidase n=1 Tax=Rubrivirga sp. TaxID=1885344 RepID=UPI003C772D79